MIHPHSQPQLLVLPEFLGCFINFGYCWHFSFSQFQLVTAQSVNYYFSCDFNNNHVSHQIINKLPLLLFSLSTLRWTTSFTWLLLCNFTKTTNPDSSSPLLSLSLCLSFATHSLWVDWFFCRCPTHRSNIGCVIYMYIYTHNEGQFLGRN